MRRFTLYTIAAGGVVGAALLATGVLFGSRRRSFWTRTAVRRAWFKSMLITRSWMRNAWVRGLARTVLSTNVLTNIVGRQLFRRLQW